jgi:hypothetical protein
MFSGLTGLIWREQVAVSSGGTGKDAGATSLAEGATPGIEIMPVLTSRSNLDGARLALTSLAIRRSEFTVTELTQTTRTRYVESLLPFR